MNAKWGQSLVAGDNADGNVYLQTPENRLNAKWQFEQDPEFHEFYYIKDLKHRQYIFSGYKYDRKVYAGNLDPSYLPNYRWKLEVARTDADRRGGRTVYLIDGSHNKALVAGSGHDDGQLYLIDNPYEPFAEWGFVVLTT